MRRESVNKSVLVAATTALAAAIAGCGGGSSPPPPLSPFDYPFDLFNATWERTGVFTAATECENCHRASGDTSPEVPAVMRDPLADTGIDVSPATQWRYSMMAHSLHDPYYLANVEEETQIFPELAGLIEDTCLTCHAPMARTHAHHTGAGLDESGFYRLLTAIDKDPDAANDIAREGIGCTACHQIADDGGLGETTFSGDFTIDPSARVIFGQYSNPVTPPMMNVVGYLPAFSAHMADSGHCATCHVLFTPTLDAETGAITGAQFLEQGVYFEWENSIFATGNIGEQQCQDCHMPDPEPGTYATRIAVAPSGAVNLNWPERGPTPPYHQHNMVGANTHILAVLRNNRDDYGIQDITTTAGFDRQIGETRTFLRTSAALELNDAVVADDTLALDLTVINRTGHKLPTSFPSRRVWVNLRVTDGDGAVVFDSGTPDSRGRIAGDAAALTEDCLAITKPADFDDSDCFAPHRDVIDDPGQVAIYEPVLGDTNGNITYVLLKAASYLKDNRIPPEGFVAANQHPDTAVIGIDGDLDFNTNGSGRDTIHYRIDVADRNGPFTVDARLLYQSIRPAFAAAIHAKQGEAEDVHGTQFHLLLDAQPPTVEQLATLNVEVDAE